MSVLAGLLALAQVLAQVDETRLQRADVEAAQWLTAGRDVAGTYYSPLARINAQNVSHLGLAWQYQTGTYRALEATPVVVDGVMFASGNWGVVYALDAATGKPLWKFDPQNAGRSGRDACCDAVNRGVALWQGRVYVGSLDGRLFALDAWRGVPIWVADTIVDHREPYTVTGAPQIAGNVVVIGNGGADMGRGGVRGYVSAYDLATGVLRWRFYVVPARDDPNPSAAMRTALSSWDAKSDPRGGTVWAGMSYDAASHLLYVGTGNAAPYQEQGRNPSGAHGDDLYCSSILALDATNGKLAWYFQSTPGDNWDQDADAPLIQADLKIDGRLRHTLMQASKNGFFYVLDRNTGELISGKPFTYVNWARALDPTGRPLITREANYTQEPRLIYPSAAGAHSWSPMSYNSRTHLVYIAVIDAPMIWVDLERKPVSFVDGMFGVGEVTPDKDYNPKDWEQWFGPMPRYGADTRGPRRVIRGVLRAWDPLKQQMRWQQETSRNYAVYDGGVMSTAGNLVLQGRADGALYAYRADNGELIASFKTGVGIMAAPMTYEVRGVQYIAVMEGYGGGLIGFPFPPIAAASRYVNEGRILALRLGGGPIPLPAQRADLSFSRPPAQRGSDVDIARGSSLYLTYCSRCHVFGAGVLPDLRSVLPGIDDHFEDIVLRGRLAAVGMDRFDDVLKPADVAALRAYLASEAWKAFNAADSTAKSTAQ